MILYKYLSPDRIDVLSKLKIRFTQFGAMNDPFEVSINIDKISEQTNIYELTKKDFKSLIEEGYEKYPVVQSIISKEDFINLALPLEEYLKPYVIENMNNVIELLPDVLKSKLDVGMGALSLSEKCDHQLMWSHYSENHMGYVIGFNGKHNYFNQRISENDELRHLRKVVYVNKRPQINLMNPNGVEIFTIKHTNWEYESEWRMILPFTDASEMIHNNKYPIYLFDFPASSISSIILGSKMEDSHKEKIKSILKSDTIYSHIELFNATLDKDTFTINIKRI
jgi:hypothetical protein